VVGVQKEKQMKLRPLGDRILIARVDAETLTPGGIIIPDSAQEKPNVGVVRAAGDGHLQPDGTIRPLQLKEGDKVMFGKYVGSDVEVNGEDLLMMGEGDVLGVVED
jgi:chaperonin GroES